MTSEAARSAAPQRPAVKPIPCPFTIVVDTNEYIRQHKGYRFDCVILADANKRYAPYIIKTMTAELPAGDYSIFGMPRVIIERKTKTDLYQSIGKRSNFVERLEMMAETGDRNAGGYAAVVVECNDVDLLIPPPFAKRSPKSVSRTILAWRQRYPVDWYFVSGRERGEMTTFRILEKFYQSQAKILK